MPTAEIDIQRIMRLIKINIQRSPHMLKQRSDANVAAEEVWARVGWWSWETRLNQLTLHRANKAEGRRGRELYGSTIKKKTESDSSSQMGEETGRDANAT